MKPASTSAVVPSRYCDPQPSQHGLRHRFENRQTPERFREPDGLKVRGVQPGQPPRDLVPDHAGVIPEKSNEIPAAQKLLEDLDVSGHIVTLDAMHCQKKPSRPPRQPRRTSSSS